MRNDSETETTEGASARQEIDCWIYKGHKRDDTYLYVADQEKMDDLPPGLLQVLGRLKLVMTLKLGPTSRLARADVVDVMKNLRDKGFYLQMPPVDPMIRETSH